MLSFFPRDVLDEIWALLSQFLRVFLPTLVSICDEPIISWDRDFLKNENLSNVWLEAYTVSFSLPTPTSPSKNNILQSAPRPTPKHNVLIRDISTERALFLIRIPAYFFTLFRTYFFFFSKTVILFMYNIQ